MTDDEFPDWGTLNSYEAWNLNNLYWEIFEDEIDSAIAVACLWDAIIQILKNIQYNPSRFERTLLYRLFLINIYPLMILKSKRVKERVTLRELQWKLHHAYEELFFPEDETYRDFINTLSEASGIPVEILIDSVCGSIQERALKYSSTKADIEINELRTHFKLAKFDPLSKASLEHLSREKVDTKKLIKYCKLYNLEPFDLALAWKNYDLDWPEQDGRSIFADLLIEAAALRPETGMAQIIRWLAKYDLGHHSHLGVKALSEFIYTYGVEAGTPWRQTKA